MQDLVVLPLQYDVVGDETRNEDLQPNCLRCGENLLVSDDDQDDLLDGSGWILLLYDQYVYHSWERYLRARDKCFDGLRCI